MYGDSVWFNFSPKGDSWYKFSAVDEEEKPSEEEEEEEETTPVEEDEPTQPEGL
jgi:hypothetical protein